MLHLFKIRKSYTTADFTQTALDDVSIAFRDSEFVAILGPSGSGKTTMLNIVGGLDHYDSGNLVIDGISTEKYKDRDWDTYRNNRIGFVFQSYNLIPHQTVLANVELALTLSGVSRRERRNRAKDALEKVGLIDHINKKPSQLSGGQMQRVAVARALINDPEILLADEPTGALDSATSTQIMELLTEIAKDRLVIMVTHNPELADEYATRIVNLRDGKIVSDSNPYMPHLSDSKVSEKPVRKTKMSFLTAISLSFNNLLTKKGRTIMTAFAGSIGIIGIAAILSLANGVNNYIKSVEEDTLTIYPLTIESTGFDMTSMMVNMMADTENDKKKEGEESEDNMVRENKMVSEMFENVGNNDLASLKTFLDSDESGIDKFINLVSYGYGIRPLVFATETEEGVRQVNPNTAFNALSSSAMSGRMGIFAANATNAGTTNIFSQMLNNPTLLEMQYDVVAGHWPENYNECIMVLNYDGTISDVTLYGMGLRDPKELDRMMEDLANQVDVVAPEDTKEFTYEEIMGVKFKLVHRSETYAKDTDRNIWISKIDDSEFMKTVVENSEELTIVGIVKPNPDASAMSLSPGISYLASMQKHLIEVASTSPIVLEQLENPEVNVFSGRTFEDEKENPDRETLDFSKMISVDGSKMGGAFNFNADALSLNMSGLTDLDIDLSQAPPMPPLDATSMMEDFEGIDLGITDEEMAELMNSVVADFLATNPIDPTKPGFSPDDITAAFIEYLNDPAVQLKMMQQFGTMVDSEAITAQVNLSLQKYMATAMQAYMGGLMKSVQSQLMAGMSSSMSSLASNMSKAMKIDSGAFMDAFKFDMGEKELQEIMMSLMSVEEATYESNLRSLGYADFAIPTSINLYPKDFSGKEEIIKILDNYNDRMSNEGKEDKVITYTDIVGTLMSSVTTIVDMVSYVLVAFVAISLVVSSIMIGIITYISVLERKKEIGILRSIGASKGDVGRVFNAETLIVGFVAGLIGIGATLLLCIPANIIVYENFGVQTVASLPWQAAIILVAISMFLSLIAGIIPSSAASRNDPVEALRSE